MGDISRAAEALQEDFDSADKVVSEIYDKYFAKYFAKEAEMYVRFRDAEVPINDLELSWIITALPLELFAVSNALAQFKQHNEIVKLTMKQRKSRDKDLPDDGLDDEFKLMSIIYSSVILRVEQQISFSKELIMGAKKVWDARRSSEQTPISPTTILDLPDYNLE